jgi:uncharacterized protein (TIGR02594 family)
MNVTAFDIAQRFIGVKEVPGAGSNAQVLAFLRLDNSWPAGDDVAWCSAFVNYVAWLLRLPRSKNLAARSWLQVGVPVTNVTDAKVGDIVILKRGEGDQPGPDVISAPGHVGFFAGYEGFSDTIHVLGGNQGDQVSVASFKASRVLGIRRIENA